MADGARVIAVEVYGQRYPIRSTLDEDYVLRLAAYVSERMNMAAESAPSSDSLRVAVLAALNIADELFRCQDSSHALDGRLAERARELEQLVDRMLLAPLGAEGR